MLSSPQFGNDLNQAVIPINAVEVRQQLRRLLAHPLFANSKRYPVLLAYTVEQTLLGNADEVKERTIGVEAFGRDPNYDVNLDPVVRMTAAEVRKRLIQYYYNPEHAGELIIELPVGSYVPLFRTQDVHSIAEEPSSLSDESHLQDGASLPIDPESTRRSSVRYWTALALAVLIAIALGFALGRIRLPKLTSNLERFWAPINSGTTRVTYCLGENLDSHHNTPVEYSGTSLNSDLNLLDVTTLARSISPLVSHNTSFRVVAASQTEFAQLREGPIVLIGAFDNPWTLRITQDLPFGFETDSINHVRKIIDRKDPQRFWTVQWQIPNTKLGRDYAIVARIHDNVTGQPVIILAGILAEGTEAAGEVVSTPEYINAILQNAPRNWDQMNLEAVIETNVIDDHAGPPTVVAVETW
jgi:hypothetical protein